MAIGQINFTVMAMLSPGITISVPSGSTTSPVTSVDAEVELGGSW